MWHTKACPRCHGDTYEQENEFNPRDTDEHCLLCGWVRPPKEKLKYLIAGQSWPVARTGLNIITKRRGKRQMDCGNDYIKMCKKAEEIQELWVPKLGDWCRSFQDVIELVTKSKDEVDTPTSCSRPEYLTIGTSFGKGGEATSEKVKWNGHISLRQYIWLPRQDQLQEMVGRLIGEESGYGLFVSLEKWLDGEEDTPNYSRYFKYSLEQLWLAFVMSECYHKIWSGTEWIVEKA